MVALRPGQSRRGAKQQTFVDRGFPATVPYQRFARPSLRSRCPPPPLLGESPKPTFIPGRYDRLEAKGVSTMGSLEAMLLIVGSTLALLYLLVRYPDGRRRTRVRP
jgi:hypothetical protein